MNKNLFIDTCKRSGNPEVDEYIEMLESIINEYYSDNSTRMVFEANKVIGIIADDLEKIAEDGDIRNTKIIKAEKNNLLMDRIVLLLKQVDSVTSISKKAVDAGKVVRGKFKKNDNTNTQLEISMAPVASNEVVEDHENEDDDYTSEFINEIAIEKLIRENESKKNK